MPVIKIEVTDSYEWILDGYFILHKADVMMGDDRIEVMDAVWVIGYRYFKSPGIY